MKFTLDNVKKQKIKDVNNIVILKYVVTNKTAAIIATTFTLNNNITVLVIQQLQLIQMLLSIELRQMQVLNLTHRNLTH